MKILQSAFIYVVMAAFTLTIAAGIWDRREVGVLYKCDDDLWLADFVPPFLHENHKGDVYLVPESRVYLVWYAYLGTSLLLPALPLALLWFCHLRYWRKQENLDDNLAYIWTW